MKSIALTLLLGVSFTLGAALTSRAADRIPQGRGQYVEVQTTAPATVALFVNSAARKSPSAVASTLRPVTVSSAHGASVTLFERVK
jgi:hypothetical protein